MHGWFFGQGAPIGRGRQIGDHFEHEEHDHVAQEDHRQALRVGGAQGRAAVLHVQHRQRGRRRARAVPVQRRELHLARRAADGHDAAPHAPDCRGGQRRQADCRLRRLRPALLDRRGADRDAPGVRDRRAERAQAAQRLVRRRPRLRHLQDGPARRVGRAQRDDFRPRPRRPHCADRLLLQGQVRGEGGGVRSDRHARPRHAHRTALPGRVAGEAQD
mmetsp:Transcript_16533/g.51449  ORF Transcript_16533/g.51449 Transcript_16533/m.51449 type:complete len:217 (-) Transcript_16533:941-1591(-)